MNNVLKQVEMVAHSDSTVLILGETGTGKELIARAIHNLSGRNGRRMVKMNCAAMCPPGCWRAICSATNAARSPGPAPSVSAASNWRTKAPCSSMKWAICRWNCSPNCCASSGAGVRTSGEQQADSDRRSIDRRHQPRSQADGYRQGNSAAISTTGSTCSRSTCRRCANVPTISRCW